jgi:hypothetical protein
MCPLVQHVLAPVLNELLNLELEETTVTRSLDRAARTAHAQSLLLTLMNLFAAAVSALPLVEPGPC